MRNRQKQAEKFLVRRFLEELLGFKIYRLLARNPGHNSHRPDIYAVVEINEGRGLLEIEMIEYQVDVSNGQKGGSPGEKLKSFWLKVTESLRRRLTRKPIEVELSVTLKDPSSVKNKDARDLAEELVRLARGFDFSASKVASIKVFQPEFPLLTEHVRTLTLKKVSFYGIAWTCTNASAAMVGVSSKRVANLVGKKANKTYTWAKKAEKWLLVCASGRSIVGRAGSPPPEQTWQDPELQAVCKTSPFDRVFFCDLPAAWYARLK